MEGTAACARWVRQRGVLQHPSALVAHTCMFRYSLRSHGTLQKSGRLHVPYIFDIPNASGPYFCSTKKSC